MLRWVYFSKKLIVNSSAIKKRKVSYPITLGPFSCIPVCPLLEKGISYGAFLTMRLYLCTVVRDTSRFCVSNGSHAAVASGNPRGGEVDLVLSNGNAVQAETRFPLTNQNRSGERTGLRSRVPRTRALEKLFHRGWFGPRRQRAVAFLSPEKRHTLTFSLDYWETWNIRSSA